MEANERERENNVTLWGDPEEPVRISTCPYDESKMIWSSYGEVTYREWCELEEERMNRNDPDRVAIRTWDGKIALVAKRGIVTTTKEDNTKED